MRTVSKSVVALALFAALNVLWSQSKIGLLSALDCPRETWTSTAVDDFLQTKGKRAQIAFLGSSLMVTPIVSVDADYLNEKMDAPYHHRSRYFEDAYSKLTGKPLTSFNFAIPGAMPTDAYLITRFLLKGEKRPDVLVYGVGPRDFIDNLLPSARATDPYRHLSRLGDLSAQMPQFLGAEEDRLNYYLGQLFFTYGYKEDIVTSFSRLVANALTPHLPPETPQQEYDYKLLVMPPQQSFAVLPKECYVAPTKKGEENKFTDNLAEYKDRYRELKWDTFLTQMQFLGETLDLAKQRDIKPVLVAMPITEGNRGLMTDFVWDLYKKNLRVVAQLKGATFIDMEATKQFTAGDFSDTVHLNARGGKKLLDKLAQTLSQIDATKTALAPHRFDDASVSTPTSVAGVRQTDL